MQLNTMIVKKLEQKLKDKLEEEIISCNKYLERQKDSPSLSTNRGKIYFYLGRISILDELLGTDSKPKLNMTYTTND